MPLRSEVVVVVRRGWWVLVVLVVSFGLVVGVAGFARAEVTFTAQSSARGVEVVVSGRSIPLSTTTVGGGPTAQTRLDSIDTSHAFAASPDLGDGVNEIGPTGCGIARLPIPPSTCADPFLAVTDRGQAPITAGAPGNTVHAESGEARAFASAVAGVGPGPSSASTSTSSVAPDGTVTTAAEATGDAIAVPGGLTLRGYHALAKAVRGPDGKLTRTGDLTFSGVDIGGQGFAFSNGNFTLAGTSIPTPAGAVLGQLAQAGIAMTYEQQVDNPNGLVSPGVSVAFQVPGVAGQTAPTDMRYTFGAAVAEVSLSTFAGYSSNVPAGPPVALPPNTTAPASTNTLGGETSQPSSGAPLAVGPAPLLAGTAPVTPVQQRTLVGLRQPRTEDSANIYLALVVAAVLVLGAAQVIRVLGVRMIWSG